MIFKILLVTATLNSFTIHGQRYILQKSLLSPNLIGLESLVTHTISQSMEKLMCVAVFCDKTYEEIFGIKLFYSLREVTFILIRISDDEDLLAPNYKTLKLLRAVRRNGCNLNIIFISNGEQVGRFLRFSDRHRELDTRSQFILLQDRKLLIPELHYLWKKVINVIFIRKFATRPGVAPWYDILTVPFPQPILDTLRLRRLDTWRGNFKLNTTLFRDKTSDLFGEMLRVVTMQHVPAAFKMPSPPQPTAVTVEGIQPIGYAGLEIEVLTALSKIMNFEPYLYDVPEDEQWGNPTANGSYTGLIGEMNAGRADVALGDLYHTPHNLRFMDLTIPYNTQCLTFLTPEALSDNSWQTLILPFKGYLWCAVLVSLLVGSITFYLLARVHQTMEDSPSIETNQVELQGRMPLTVKNNFTPQPLLEGHYYFLEVDNSFLYTYSMLLLVSLPKLPAGWSLRVLTGCWWLSSILLVVAYRASMTAILANPAPRVTIDTMEQLADSKVQVGSWSEEVKRFFQTSLDPAGKKLGSRFQIEKNIDAAVTRIALGDFAFYENIYFLEHATVRRQILTTEAARKSNNRSETNNDRNLHIMSNCVIYMPISLGLQKNSPLKPRVDRYLRLITQAGLVQKWLQDAMMQVLAADHSDAAKSKKALMNLKKFLGALVALGCGYAISFIVFIIEIVYWRLTIVRNPQYDRYSNAIVVKNATKILNNEIDKHRDKGVLSIVRKRMKK